MSQKSPPPPDSTVGVLLLIKEEKVKILNIRYFSSFTGWGAPPAGGGRGRRGKKAFETPSTLFQPRGSGIQSG
jgi:hypothetical protein